MYSLLLVTNTLNSLLFRHALVMIPAQQGAYANLECVPQGLNALYLRVGLDIDMDICTGDYDAIDPNPAIDVREVFP